MVKHSIFLHRAYVSQAQKGVYDASERVVVVVLHTGCVCVCVFLEGGSLCISGP